LGDEEEKTTIGMKKAVPGKKEDDQPKNRLAIQSSPTRGREHQMGGKERISEKKQRVRASRTGPPVPERATAAL